MRLARGDRWKPHDISERLRRVGGEQCPAGYWNLDFLRRFSLVGSMLFTLFPLNSFGPEMSFSSPHTDDQHRRKRQEAG